MRVTYKELQTNEVRDKTIVVAIKLLDCEIKNLDADELIKRYPKESR